MDICPYNRAVALLGNRKSPQKQLGSSPIIYTQMGVCELVPLVCTNTRSCVGRVPPRTPHHQHAGWRLYCCTQAPQSLAARGVGRACTQSPSINLSDVVQTFMMRRQWTSTGSSSRASGCAAGLRPAVAALPLSRICDRGLRARQMESEAPTSPRRTPRKGPPLGWGSCREVHRSSRQAFAPPLRAPGSSRKRRSAAK